jgi:hypothetical protein
MLRSMKDLHGFRIGATDGDIGTVQECYFDDVSYTVRYVVVDTGGWLGERKVLLSPIAFRAMDPAIARSGNARAAYAVRFRDLRYDYPEHNARATLGATVFLTSDLQSVDERFGLASAEPR